MPAPPPLEGRLSGALFRPIMIHGKTLQLARAGVGKPLFLPGSRRLVAGGGAFLFRGYKHPLLIGSRKRPLPDPQ